jgi:hypothetical protein
MNYYYCHRVTGYRLMDRAGVITLPSLSDSRPAECDRLGKETEQGIRQSLLLTD